jgi:hypothetical protein
MPVHERMEEGLDQPLGIHQYPWISFFVIIQGEAGISSRLGMWVGWMCDVWLRAWKEYDFGYHTVCGVCFQKPDILSFGLGQPPLGHQSGVYMDSPQLWDFWNISVRRITRDVSSESFLSSFCVGNWGPCTSFLNSPILLYLVSIWVGAKIKRLLIKCTLDDFKRGYIGDYNVELTP